MTNLRTIIKLLILVSAPGIALAEPASINISGISVVPSIKIEETYDSNIFYTETDETSSIISIISPSVQAGVQNGPNLYTLQASLQAGLYTESSNDNYLDSQAQADIHHEFTRRSQIDLTAQYSKAHENRGTGYSQGRANTITEPDRYYTLHAGSSYTYGSRDAIGRVTLSTSILTKTYTNNSASSKSRDRNNFNVGATFFYNIQPKTALLFELRHSQIDYKLDTSSLDSTENRIYAGAEWDITNMTTGNVRAGLLQKNFDSAARETSTGFSWEAGAEWSPLTYTRFTLQTTSTTDEAFGIDSFINSKVLAVSWIHDWSNQVSTQLDSLVVKNDYNPSPREEGIVSVSSEIHYEMRRWLTLSLKAGHSQRLSNQRQQDYKKNEISVNILATL